MHKIVVALTGASGVIYGIRLVEELLKRAFEVHLIVSDPAKIVIEQELKWEFNDSTEETLKNYFNNPNLYIHQNSNIAAPIASGSFLVDSMVVIPCTMSTVSNIAHGTSQKLTGKGS